MPPLAAVSLIPPSELEEFAMYPQKVRDAILRELPVMQEILVAPERVRHMRLLSERGHGAFGTLSRRF